MATPSTSVPDLLIPGIGRAVAWFCKEQKRPTDTLRESTALAPEQFARFLQGKQPIRFFQLEKVASKLGLSLEALLQVGRDYAAAHKVHTKTLNAVLEAGKKMAEKTNEANRAQNASGEGAKPKPQPVAGRRNTPKVPRSRTAANIAARFVRAQALEAALRVAAR